MEPIPIGETTMKKLILLLLIAGLQACAKIDKFDRSVNNYNYSARMMAVGINEPSENRMVSITEDQPETYVSDHDLFAPVPEVNNYQASYQEEKTLDEILEENRILQAKQRNAWLRSQM
jgi:hypothetical protein